MTATIARMALVPVFLEVARRGSFTAAAKTLGLPKSTISRRVAELERDLGVQLVARTTRTLRLTEAGRELLDSAGAALERLEEATEAIAVQQRIPRGTLRVTAPSDGGHRMLAECVASFVDKYPEVRVELVLTQRLVDLVGEGFDLAIRASRRLPDSSLVARKLSTSDLALFAARSYLERRGRPRTLADLADHDCIVFGPARTLRFDGPRGPEEIDMRGRITVDDFGLVRDLVRSGAGIGLIPALQLPECMEASAIERVLPEHAIGGSSLYVVYPASRHVPPKVAAFRDHLVDAFRRATHLELAR